MTKENKEFLDKNRHFYDQMNKAQTLSGLSWNVKEGMQRVMGQEFQPGYVADLNCGSCIFDMVKLLYQSYERWLSENKIEVKANFPKHNKM